MAKPLRAEPPIFTASINQVAKVEKIVDYSFEKNKKFNVLAIHQTRPLIAYLINIQRTPKVSKGGWSANDSIQSSSGSISHSIGGSSTKLNQSIRIIDYDTRQRCLAKGVYHARPADCVFTINSVTCAQSDIIKLAVVDQTSNIYLYDLSYINNELAATRISVIRGPGEDCSPYESIQLVWCPYVPCEDFDDGDGGLRLALAIDSTIEVFAVDRLSGKTGELQRSELKGSYKCIQDSHKANIVTLSISPDCSTILAAASDNRVTFFTSDIDDGGQMCLHDWEVNSITDKSSISRLFFLDDYPKLLQDSTIKFWGVAFIGSKGGQMMLLDLRTWSVYQKTTIQTDALTPREFDYRIDYTSRNIIAMNGNQCYIVQIDHSHQEKTSKIIRITQLSLHNTIYSFVIKHKSDDELELFTISAYSLERYMINLNKISDQHVEDVPMTESAPAMRVQPEPEPPVKAYAYVNNNGPSVNNTKDAANSLDVNQMNRVVEVLFTKLNTAFSQGLDEFLNDIRIEVNDLKLKLNGLSKEVRKLQNQLQDVRHK